MWKTVSLGVLSLQSLRGSFFLPLLLAIRSTSETQTQRSVASTPFMLSEPLLRNEDPHGPDERHDAPDQASEQVGGGAGAYGCGGLHTESVAVGCFKQEIHMRVLDPFAALMNRQHRERSGNQHCGQLKWSLGVLQTGAVDPSWITDPDFIKLSMC